MKKFLLIALVFALIASLFTAPLTAFAGSGQGQAKKVGGKWSSFRVEDLRRATGKNMNMGMTESQHQQVVAAMSAWDELNAKRMLLEAEGADTKRVTAEMESIDNRISALGAVDLTTEQVEMLFSSVQTGDPNVVTPKALPTKPADSSHTKWTASGPVNQTSGGVTYKVYHIFATSYTGSSSLAQDIQFALYDVKNEPIKNFAKQMLNIYASKVVGSIPVLGWLPYELVWPSGVPSDITSADKFSVSGKISGKVCFSFVSKDGTNYYMTMSSHTYSAAETDSYSGYRTNGKAYSLGASKSYSKASDYYASSAQAAKLYTSQTAYYGVPAFTYSYRGKTKSISLPLFIGMGTV